MVSKKIYLLILAILSLLSLLTFFQTFSQNSVILYYDRSKNDPVVIFSSNSLRNYSNLPIFYNDEKLKISKSFNKTCAKFPDFFELKFHNDFWQKQSITNGTFNLLSAYIDERNGSWVRILGTLDIWKTQQRFWCQFWYDSDQPELVQSEPPYWLFRQKWGADKAYFHHPYLITCPLLKKKDNFPLSVSLVENPCDSPSNNLKLTPRKFPSKKNFVVCVKGLSFPNEDKSLRLAEWIELLRLLGAEKINFYEFSVHPNVERLLQYYSRQELIEVTPISIVGDVSNIPLLQNRFLRKKLVARRLQEVLPYNDCLYKHLQEFKYVVLLDTDEVIVPLKGTWRELIATLEKMIPNTSSYVARNVYFLDSHQHDHDWFEDIPKYMHMLQHVTRAENYTKPGHFVKGFHNTTKVTSLHNHYPFSCLGACNNKEIDLKLAHLQHYRADCVAGVSNCKDMKENSLKDFRVWNFKNDLIERVTKTLRELNLIDT